MYGGKALHRKDRWPQNIAKYLTTAPLDIVQSNFLNKFTGNPFFKLSCFSVSQMVEPRNQGAGISEQREQRFEDGNSAGQ